MMKKKENPEDVAIVPFTVNVRASIVRDFKQMEKVAKIPVDDLVTKALLMYIATHNDYLGRIKTS